MKCSRCGFDIKDGVKPCPECGHVVTEQEDLDHIIQDLLDEDDYEPMFQEGQEDKKDDKGKKVSPKKSPSQTIVRKNEPKPKVAPKKEPEARNIGDMVVTGLRYLLVIVVLLFTLSLNFNWFTLNGSAVNQGFIRTEENQSFLYSGVVNKTIEQLDTYNGPVVVFSGMDLYNFGKMNPESYKTVIGPGGSENVSLASRIHRYYMLSLFGIIFVNIMALGMLLFGRRLKGITIVRNLSMLNFVVIGLNYLAIKVTFFSMFAIKAKDLLAQSMDYPEISMTAKGIAMNQSFYAYNVVELRGFYVSMIMLGVWLFIGIILSEVKHRRDEIAIEKGEA